MRKPILEPNYLVAIQNLGEHDRRTAPSASCAKRTVQLFNVRSAFLHGRTMAAISTDERVLARSLARQVVEALILATKAGPIPRGKTSSMIYSIAAFR